MVPGKRYKKVFDQETSLLAYYGEANPDDSESEEEPRPKASAHHSSEIKQKEEALKRTWGMGKRKSPVLIAAENGIIEMVEKILKLFPAAVRHVDSDQKNIVLLAVKNRQISVYELLLNRKPLEESAFRMVDSEGNSALHLAATLGDYRPYPFAALQMQWEIKWYKYVKNSVPRHFFIRYNNKNQVPKEIFTESHKELVREGGKWLNNTSNSCSVVATLVTTVAFATTATIPGGFKENSSEPTLQHHPGFLVYAISSLIALSFSVTSVVTFLAILTSRYQVKDFGRGLPRKLLLVACLPVTFFAVAQFPFYFDLIWAIFKKVPQRTIYG
ncbi:ankyrin repeat-containing protein ITN1-like [Vitis riparia]|uniref:ankyrin repeat-containing protein ITN1-like n=1 Tax=Vitis riparia TaxID=96939 RepID=UPI00155AA509|nr:ankyrin repeat-containing protein ITN1-like [Vitis riparia]